MVTSVAAMLGAWFCLAELADEGGVGEHEDGFGDGTPKAGTARACAEFSEGSGSILHRRAGRSATGFGAGFGTTGFSHKVLCAHPS